MLAMLLQVNVVVVVALLRLFLSLIKSTNSKTCVSSKKERGEKVKSFQIVEVKRIHTIFFFFVLANDATLYVLFSRKWIRH